MVRAVSGTIICIPAHNEANNIARMVEGCKPYGEVVVVDDGSTDGTAVQAKQAGATILSNSSDAEYRDGFSRGFLYAIRQKATYLAFIDAGFSYSPTYLADVLAAAQHSDIVQSVRIEPRLFSRLARAMLRFLSGEHRADYASLRGFRNPSLHLLDMCILGTSLRAHTFNPQLSLRLYGQHQHSIYHVGVRYTPTNSTLRPWGVVGAAIEFTLFYLKERIWPYR